MAGIREYEVGQKASIMVGAKRFSVEVVEVGDLKVIVKRKNGETLKLYKNALLAPEQTAHYRSVECDASQVARAANTLAADGYGLHTVVDMHDGTVRVVGGRVVPAQDEPEATDEGSEA